MGRFFQWIKSLFNRFMDKVEDPEMLLDQAKRDMQGALVGNREKAVQAITQRNRLQGMYDEALKRSEKLEQQATMALQQGKRDIARQLIREKTANDAQLESLRTSLEQATQTVEQVKVAIRRQEEEVRKKTAEALALKAQWKQAQIQSSISKALEGLTFENQFEGFGAAQEKIREAQSEAAARQEMLGTSVQGKIMEMEDQAIDTAAEAELQKLEERLGMRPASAPAEQTQQVSVGGEAPVQESAVDKELEELERRLKGG